MQRRLVLALVVALGVLHATYALAVVLCARQKPDVTFNAGVPLLAPKHGTGPS